MNKRCCIEKVLEEENRENSEIDDFRIDQVILSANYF